MAVFSAHKFNTIGESRGQLKLVLCKPPNKIPDLTEETSYMREQGKRAEESP